MTRTRVKICGITSTADAQAAAACGVDAIGLMFRADSKRFVSVELACSIALGVPAFVTRVGVFADADPGEVREICQAVQVDLLQFHGGEPPQYCEQFARPYMKVIPATSAEEISEAAGRYPSASALLLDTVSGGQFGGTGKRFDWSVIPPIDRPLVLAGGITPGNVGQAIRVVKPWAVDLSTGVEIEKGIKDPGKIRDLISEVCKADSAQ